MSVRPESTNLIDQLDAEIAQTGETYHRCTTNKQRQTVENWLGYLHNRRAEELEIQDEFERIMIGAW